MMKWLSIILAISLPACLSAQMDIIFRESVEQYVRDVLLGGGVIVRNVEFTGGELQIAEFNASGTNLQFNKGIVLVTGDAKICKSTFEAASGDNFNTRDNSTSAFFNAAASTTLSGLSGGGTTFDIAILEFDFIPLGDTIQFRYSFASEEYHEYNCTQFNDVFGFFLTGPEYPTAVNLARLPVTNEVVSINTVNNGTIGVENGRIENCSPPNGSLDRTDFFRDNVGGAWLEFDGLTIGLEAKAAVTPCETYNIKLAIADIADANLDSGVFFDRKSFRSVGMEVLVITENQDNVMVEGCTDARLVFIVPTNEDQVCIRIKLEGDAQRGSDYLDNFPDVACFNPNKRRDTFDITTLADAFSEGSESLQIIYDLPGCEIQDTVTLDLREEGILRVNPDTIRILAGQETTIPLNASFGQSPMGTFSWSPPEFIADPTISNTTATVSEPQTFTVTYEDGDCVQMKTVHVEIYSNLEYYIPNVFSPNGDGVNDRFVISFSQDVQFDSELTIFDRWGSVVFTNRSFNRVGEIAWDGTSNGTSAAPGVYGYLLKVDTPGSEDTQTISGDVTLVR